MKILLTPQQESTLKSISCMVYYSSSYYFVPFFFKEESDGIYDQLIWDDLPEPVKDIILRMKGVKLPTSTEQDDNTTNGDPDLY